MDIVEFTVQPGLTCDMSGEEIETMKPSFRFLGIIIMSKEESRELVNILRNIEKGEQVEKFNIDFIYNQSSGTNKCEMCREMVDEYIALLAKNITDYASNNKFLCTECCGEICEK